MRFTGQNANADYNETLLEAMDLVQLIDNAIKSDPAVLRAKQNEAVFLYDSAISESAAIAENQNAAFGELPQSVADTVSALVSPSTRQWPLLTRHSKAAQKKQMLLTRRSC